MDLKPFSTDTMKYGDLLCLFTASCKDNRAKVVSHLINAAPIGDKSIIDEWIKAVECSHEELAIVLLDRITFTDDNYDLIIKIMNTCIVPATVVKKILDRCRPITHEIANLLGEEYKDVVDNAIKDKLLPHMFAGLSDEYLSSKTNDMHVGRYAWDEIERRIDAHNEAKESHSQ